MRSILAPNGRPARLEVRAHYDAVQQVPSRSNLPGVVQSAGLDANPMARRILIKSSRSLYKNSPFVRGLTERIVTLAIGSGIQFLPSTASERYNQASLSRLKRWYKRPAVGCPFMWYQIQRMILRAVITDGEMFAYHTSKDGEPRIKLIESHLIGRGYSKTWSGEPDGIVLDSDGDPVAYEYYPDQRHKKPILLPAENVTHFTLPDRADLYRGVTPYHAAITTAHDVHDILALEKAAVKDVSRKTDVITTASGEYDAEQAHANGAVVPNTTDSTKFYQDVYGPDAVIMRNGDTYTPYEPKRPGPAWQGFVDFLTQVCVMCLRMPPNVLLPMKVGGADTRATWATAAREIEIYQQDIVPGLESIINFVQYDDIANRRVTNSPSDWDALTCQFPRRVTSDYGRDSQSDREDVKMGMLSLRDYYGGEGCNWKEEIRQIADEQAYIKEIAEEKGLEPHDLMMKNPNQQMDQGSNAQAPGTDQDTSAV